MFTLNNITKLGRQLFKNISIHKIINKIQNLKVILIYSKNVLKYS